LPLKAKLDPRAMTMSSRKRDKAAMMSSVTPSAKYSCSGSPLMFWKGRTAIEGFSATIMGAGAGGVDFAISLMVGDLSGRMSRNSATSDLVAAPVAFSWPLGATTRSG